MGTCWKKEVKQQNIRGKLTNILLEREIAPKPHKRISGCSACVFVFASLKNPEWFFCDSLSGLNNVESFLCLFCWLLLFLHWGLNLRVVYLMSGTLLTILWTPHEDWTAFRPFADVAVGPGENKTGHLLRGQWGIRTCFPLLLLHPPPP